MLSVMSITHPLRSYLHPANTSAILFQKRYVMDDDIIGWEEPPYDFPSLYDQNGTTGEYYPGGLPE